MLYWIVKIVLTPIFFVCWRIRIVDRDRVPKEGGVILAANHQSFCDSFFLPVTVFRRVTYLAKAEYFNDKRMAWFFRAVGQIPIQRSGGDASQRALDTATSVLDRGHIIAMYPEGTRALDEYVHKGRTGIARLALCTGAPVIPVGLRGTTEVQPVGSNMLRPFKRVEVRYGEPMTLSQADVEQAGSETDALRAFTDRLMTTIAELSGRPYLDEYIERPTPPR